MNYGWSNPSTGTREQASTKAEARRRAWEQMQPLPVISGTVQVYEQEPAGQVGPTTDTQTNRVPWESYAWASPHDGTRYWQRTWAGAVDAIQKNWPAHDVSEEVTVYRQRAAFTVLRSDPDPRQEAPAAPPVIPQDPDSIEALMLGIQSGSIELGYASVMASLRIARALERIAADYCGLVPVGEPPEEFTEFARRQLYGLAGKPESEPTESPEDRRARLVRQRTYSTSTAERNAVHGFSGIGSLCMACGMPEKHANHGWTGE